VEKLLPDRPPLPPGAIYPKTLVLNLRGTLLSQEYKFGVGYEILKRPGLSVFMQRMSRYYEIVIFGEEENGVRNQLLSYMYSLFKRFVNHWILNI
jgi:TFIIF-interacting CTD phosphatase-like protein